MMITDGSPDRNHQEVVLDLIRRSESSGGEIIGLGIEARAVEKLFPKYTVIDRLSELKSSLFLLVHGWLVY